MVKPRLHLNLPVEEEDSKLRSLPPESGNLVVFFLDQGQNDAALSWFAALVVRSFATPIVIRSISLWDNAQKTVEQLGARGLEARFSKFQRTEFVTVVCNAAEGVKAALEVFWPNAAEALVIHEMYSVADDERLIESVANSRKGHEDDYAAHLQRYGCFCFMESGRLSLEFIGWERNILKVLAAAIELKEKTGE